MSNGVDYGPLAMLIGTWKGGKGKDVSPEPTGQQEIPFSEVITFSEVGMVDNADQQHLAALGYHQVVTRLDTNKVFHDQMGYWMWDAATGTVMQSLVIPRAVAVLAGGTFKGDAKGSTVNLYVESKLDDKKWTIAQSPFMQEKARTLEFYHTIKVSARELTYRETTMLDIYGKKFKHTDENTLTKS